MLLKKILSFAAQHNFELHQIRDGRKTVDIYNIQRVNAFHSSLKSWINKFNGVNYLKQKWKEIFVPHLIANYAIGISTSMFSIFVLVMSWG